MRVFGMGIMRGSGRALAAMLWLVVLSPALALIPAALLDRGPGGTVRLPLLPIALGVLDPYIRTCARNSLLMAGAVTLLSLLLGVGVALAGARWRFWGRGLLTGLILAPIVVPPVVTALGVRLLIGPSRLAWQGPGHPLGGWLPWLGWGWVALISGVPLVALSAASALVRVEAGWIDAARLEGASRLTIWRQLIWPVVRPDAARAAGAVFTLTLVEPGGPLVLGVRRTLAYQIVEAAMAADPIPRAAILALVAVGLAAIGRFLLHGWGGPTYQLPSAWPSVRPIFPHPAVAWGLSLALAAGVVAAWLPEAAVFSASVTWTPGGLGSSARRSAAALFLPLNDPALRALLFNSLALGAGVVALDIGLALGLASRGSRRGGWLTPLAVWPEAFPPLAIAVGALALPWIVRAAADASAAAPGLGRAGAALSALAECLDPSRTPGFLLLIAVAAVRLPLLARVAQYGRARLRPALIDAALTLGASTRQARRMAAGRWLGLTPGLGLLTFALAATNLAPSLLLAPAETSRTLAPGVLLRADEPGDGLHDAAVLGTLAIALNVGALGLAALDRPGALARWIRE